MTTTPSPVRILLTFMPVRSPHSTWLLHSGRAALTPLLLPARAQPQLGHEEGEPIRRLVNQLRRRLAGPVPGLGLNPDQDRILPRVHCLQPRRELETVGRHHP